MENFSIELASEKIDDPRTKTYFREVYSSYVNGNYRSAVVMLWTVVICDLIYKLQNLRDMYEDQIAQHILDNIEEIQKKNPHSPEWEKVLVNDVNSKTELLDNAEHHAILSLQKYRHLSAHPVLGTADLLYSPNQETVRSLMRNMLEGVLLKSPMLSKKIFSELVSDLASKKNLLPDRDSLKKYLEAKYFKNLKPAVENYIFRTLWKFSFTLSDSEANNNRKINVQALSVIYDRHPDVFKKCIRDEAGYYSNVVPGNPLQYLVEFISEYPSLYEVLSNHARVLIKNSTKDDLNLFAISSYLSDSIVEHLEQVAKLIDCAVFSNASELLSQSAWEKIQVLSRDASLQHIALHVAIQSFIKSKSFDCADTAFSRFIEPCLANFSDNELIEIISGIEKNNQIYGRRKASTEHKKIKQYCDNTLGPTFDYTTFPRFLSSIED